MPPFETKLVGPQADFQIIVLVLDTPVDTVFEKHGHYSSVFVELFEKARALEPRITQGIQFLAYDCVRGDYPSEEELSKSQGLVMTGSAASAYEPVPWITKLVDFIAALPSRHPACKIIGICFGHQIVARAFGANVIKNPEGWELGVRTIQLTPMGQKLLARNEETAKNIEQVHQDHVTSIPPGFHNLAFTPICPFQGLVRFSSAPSLSASREELFAQINVFTLQGHPEFTADIVHDVIDVREAKGIFSKEFSDQSKADALLPQDGVELGRVILGIIGVH